MSATRNRNTPGNYAAEQTALQAQRDFRDFTGSVVSDNTMFSGNGLLPARVGASALAHNACDIESMLLGVGSTNLVERRLPILPDIRHLPSLSIADRLPVTLPAPLVLEPFRRPRPL